MESGVELVFCTFLPEVQADHTGISDAGECQAPGPGGHASSDPQGPEWDVSTSHMASPETVTANKRGEEGSFPSNNLTPVDNVTLTSM